MNHPDAEKIALDALLPWAGEALGKACHSSRPCTSSYLVGQHIRGEGLCLPSLPVPLRAGTSTSEFAQEPFVSRNRSPAAVVASLPETSESELRTLAAAERPADSLPFAAGRAAHEAVPACAPCCSHNPLADLTIANIRIRSENRARRRIRHAAAQSSYRDEPNAADAVHALADTVCTVAEVR